LLIKKPSLKFSLSCSVDIPGKDQPYYVQRFYPNEEFTKIDSKKEITRVVEALKQNIINTLGNNFPGIQISEQELDVKCEIYDNQQTVASLIQKDLEA